MKHSRCTRTTSTRETSLLETEAQEKYAYGNESIDKEEPPPPLALSPDQLT